MNEEIVGIKKNIIAIGRLLWEKELANGLNGNISVRVDDETILMTATKTCLGLLHEKDILHMKINGDLLDEDGSVSTEALLHTEIYKKFSQVRSVIHTHTTFTNAYFLENDVLKPRIFEAKFYLGDVFSVDQKTPSVTDAAPVLERLQGNNITVLRNHGSVAMSDDLFDCFLLIQGLEESIKVEAISHLFKKQTTVDPEPEAECCAPAVTYKLFSKEQIDEIVCLVNSDPALKDLGLKTSMTMKLAVQLNETGQIYCFDFENGQIRNVDNDPDAEFLISAPENVWRAVFNREIDPFVATTQKKMNLRGDFAKISKWYAPCSRIFELWQQVPVD